MADKRKYSFTEKKKSRGGIFSTRLAIVSLILFFVDLGISFSRGGKGGSIVGVIGICALLFSVYGFCVGMKSFGEKDASPAYSIAGSILSGVVMVGWIALLLTGF